jgi:hypothetical protein
LSAAITIENPPSILEIPHGIHPDVPESVYHSRVLGLASKSMLDRVRHSLLHYRDEVAGGSREPTPALEFGQAFHCAVFEPARFEASYACEPDFGDCRKTENKKARDDWRKAHEGRKPISAAENTAIQGMVEKLRAHPMAARLIFGGAQEVTLRWRDRATGLECKGRLDYYLAARHIAVDLKTTEDVRLAQFARSVARFGYHRQEAMYRDACETLGQPLQHFVFIAIEKARPYDVAVYTLDLTTVAKGHTTIREDMQRLAEALATDQWPGHSDTIQTITLPDWSE